MTLFYLKTAKGRDLRLREFYQGETYEGLLMGVPDADLNRRLLEVHRTLIAGVAEKRSTRSYVVIPTPIPFEVPGRVEEASERLPHVLCWGVLESDPVQPVGNDLSYAVVGWFQDHPGVPDATAFLNVPWEEFAVDAGI